jgi:hypothetical protein
MYRVSTGLWVDRNRNRAVQTLPYTGMAAPRMSWAASDAKKQMTLAKDSGLTH